MKKILLLGMSLAALFAGEAQAKIITFDDVGPGGALPDGYAGLHWDNFYYINGTSQINNGYHAAVVSPDYVAFNGSGTPAMVSDTTFNLFSAYLTGVWRDGLQVEVIGSRGGTVVPGYDNTYTLSSTASTLITFAYYDVDTVQFISSGGVKNPNYTSDGTQFAMDNLLVPEPTTALLLLAFGPGVLWMLRRRRGA